MRGKLRDKRAASRRDSFKQREVIERRRPGKRESRSDWLNQQEDEDLELEIEDEDDQDEDFSPKK